MKNFFKYATLICSIFILLLINNSSVNAATQSFYSRAVRDSAGNIRFKWAYPGKPSVNATKIMKWSSGEPVYCIEPGKNYLDFSDGGYNYTENQDSVVSISQLTKEGLRKLKLFSYFGYGYGNHTDDSWYLATQLEIWNTLVPGCCYITSGDSALIESQRAEIRNLVNGITTLPSFQNGIYTQVVGKTVEYTDTNNVISNYSVSGCTNCTANISGNKLIVKADTVGSATVDLTRTVTNIYSPSIIYYNSSYQKLMEFGSPDPMIANLNLNVVGGKIKITKIDSENKTTTPSGQANLVGAKYEVIDSNDSVVATLTIGSDMTSTTDNLPTGTYKIKEISAPNGYKINSEVYTATIDSGDTVNVTVEDEVIKNYISILKQYDYVDGNTTFLNAEANISFEIYYPDGRLYDTITTDKNGYASINIPYGVWKFHQVNSTTGFEKIYDFFVTVDENSEKEQYYNILNNKISAYLQIYKKDSETGKTIELADTTFKILNTDTNQYVSQYVGGKVYDKFKTDKNGVSTTYLKLEAGNYIIEEIYSPKNYLINTEGVDFTIGEETEYYYTTYGAFVVVEFENTPIKGQVEIVKSGETFVIEDNTFKYGETKLERIKFNLYADEDIKSSDGNYLYYNKGDLIEILVSNNRGYAISKELPLGKYFLVEVETKDNYVLDTKEYHFELTAKDNKTAIVYEKYETLNYLKKGDLEFTKTDLVDGEPIPNTVIEIYTEKDELIFSGKTDKNGFISLKNIPIGRFYIKEREAATGFVLSDENVYFEIKENNEIVKATMTNKPITGKLEFTKVDLATSEPIPNTLIEVYTEKDELVFSGHTDDKGMLIVEGLKYGKYYILEKETASEDYMLNTEKTYFEIKEDEEIVKAKMTNEKVIVEVPDTLTKQPYKVYIISLAIALMGVCILLYGNQKKR